MTHGHSLRDSRTFNKHSWESNYGHKCLPPSILDFWGLTQTCKPSYVYFSKIFFSSSFGVMNFWTLCSGEVVDEMSVSHANSKWVYLICFYYKSFIDNIELTNPYSYTIFWNNWTSIWFNSGENAIKVVQTCPWVTLCLPSTQIIVVDSENPICVFFCPVIL